MSRFSEYSILRELDRRYPFKKIVFSVRILNCLKKLARNRKVFFRLEKYFLFGSEKKVEQSFDVKNSGESIPLLFRAIQVLPEELGSFLLKKFFFKPEI